MEFADEGFDFCQGGSIAFAIFGGEALCNVRDVVVSGMNSAGLPEATIHRG